MAKPTISLTNEQMNLRDAHLAAFHEARELAHEAADALKQDQSVSALLMTIEVALTTLLAARKAARLSLVSALHLSQNMSGEGELIK